MRIDFAASKKNFASRFAFIAVVFVVSVGVGMLLTQESVRAPLGAASLSRATGVFEFSWSPDSTDVAFVSAQGGTSEIWLVDIAAGAPRRITSDGLPKSDPQWSPDGRWIAFVATPADGRTDIFGVSSDGAETRQFVATASGESAPRWSPDSSQLLFLSDAEGPDRLMVIDLESGEIRTISDTPASDPQWSPDGESIAFVSDPLPNDDRRDNEDIFVVPAEGGPTRLLTPGTQRYRDYAPSWSPDSTRLAFVSERNGFSNLYTIGLDGRNRTPLTDTELDQHRPRWSPDGRSIAFVQVEDFEFHVWLIPAGGGRPIQVSDRAGTNGGFQRPNQGPAGTLGWSPDGRFLAFTHSDPARTSDIWIVPGGGVRPTPLTNSMPVELRRESQFTSPEIQTYRSFDGMDIRALIYRPTARGGQDRHPAILVFRDTVEGANAIAWDPFIQSFVSNGYLVFAPNIRGSGGQGRDYRQSIFGQGGDADIRDALIGLDSLSADGVIDAERVGVFGAGSGGFHAAAALARDGSRFGAAVSLEGITDLVTAASYPVTASWIRYMAGGTPMDVPRPYYERSLINFVGTLRTPIIFLYGGADVSVPFQQIEQFAVQAEVEGKWFDYRAFAGEPHGWQHWRPNSVRVALEAAHALFDTHLLGRARPITLSRNR